MGENRTDGDGHRDWQRLAAEMRLEAASMPTPLIGWHLDERVSIANIG